MYAYGKLRFVKCNIDANSIDEQKIKRREKKNENRQISKGN